MRLGRHSGQIELVDERSDCSDEIVVFDPLIRPSR